MNVEIAMIEGLQIPCRMVKIPDDGSYLFFSLVYGDVSMMAKIRVDIVSHVPNNLQRFKCFNQQRFGIPHGTKLQYLSGMSSPEFFIY
ncbi:hypothetical protein AVEN_123008-1 [Araneus ventricosus]|uniref:Uncharacterized protein n=1 Tax=Araneus ventricosus TaxID=182803 RepID=A0A4Y2CUJ1_ARAVE|nr:hypothetical protein AVEN_123008-1 [Araneus ventricosus]